MTIPTLETVTPPHQRAFIEVQFPVAKLSAESYKERKAGSGQTLTGLGKWWGRKPLVLVRAIIIGLLMPASDDPQGDMDTFLAIMTMDDEGLHRRRNKPFTAGQLSMALGQDAVKSAITNGKWKSGLSAATKNRLQDAAFDELPYEEKIARCVRPEEIDGPSPEAWEKINAHLGTSASSIPELVQELGKRRYGHTPTVGDAFAGGGSIPFEAARIGADVYASDINPVAGLLTWAALNIVGGGEDVVAEVKRAQEEVYAAVKQQVDDWGIERNEQGWIAEAYLYCNEVLDPRTGWRVPLAPSWVIATKTNVYANLVPDHAEKRFDIEIIENGSAADIKRAAAEGTWSNGVKSPVGRDGQWLDSAHRTSTTVETIRGPQGLRRWTNDDVVPRPDDVFQERLYCIRYRDPATGKRHYVAPDDHDLAREQRVLELLQERFADWQEQGFIPSREIEPGNKTDEPIRTRGWTHWHHLFNPRQLLLGGLFANCSKDTELKTISERASLLVTGKLADFNSKLTRWDSSRDEGKQTYYNQALNTLLNHSCRTTSTLRNYIAPSLVSSGVGMIDSLVELIPVQQLNQTNDFWITDPGYGDMVNYDEISEFFLAWYEKRLPKLFPDWYADSRRSLNIKGEGEQFRLGLTEAYTNLAKNMPDDGYQVIMFTHQDPSVWADVGLTIWAAGLQVVTAWTIATETGSAGIRQGNYVQGTVCLILRKRAADSFGYLSDISPEIETEVKQQLESMRTLDNDADPSFGDADYQLAAYAAALRVLTSYSEIDEINVELELSRPRVKGQQNPITKLIEQAVEIATNEIVPRGLDSRTWRRLGPDERLYLKAIEVEAGGEGREGVYTELARSFGAAGYADLVGSGLANKTRFKTPSEFRARIVSTPGSVGFGGTTLRHLLLAIFETADHEELDPRPARDRLAADMGQTYWQERDRYLQILEFLRRHGQHLQHWERDVQAIEALSGSLRRHNV